MGYSSEASMKFGRNSTTEKSVVNQAVEHLKPVLGKSPATQSRAGITLSVDNSVMDRFGKLLRCTWSWYSGRCHDVVRGQDLLGVVLTINHLA